MDKLVTCLWFDKGTAREAAEFYAATFPDSRVGDATVSTIDYPGGGDGDEITVEFTVLGRAFVGLNGGPGVVPNEGVSFQVLTDDQDETDRYWNAIVDGGGAALACSWCRDRWGHFWQIVPRMLLDALKDPDRAAAKRVMEAMTTMKKIDIAAIEAARAGGETVMTDESLDLFVSRLIDAPVARVWQVATERMADYWCPKPWTVEIVEQDWRAGGRSAMVMRGPDGEEMPQEGVFLEVVPEQRFVFTDALTAGWHPRGPFMVGIVEFADEGGKTRYTATARHWTRQARDEHEAMGFEQGWSTVAAQLAALAEANR